MVYISNLVVKKMSWAHSTMKTPTVSNTCSDIDSSQSYLSYFTVENS